MGLLDSILKEVAPGGQLAPPVKTAISSLFADNTAGSGSPQNPQAQAGSANAAGGAAGGLLGVLKNLEATGHGDTVKSWVGNGPNAPIDPKHLGAAIGQKKVTNMAQQAGVSEQQLLTQLAQTLPALVNKLCPNGQLPNAQQIAAFVQQL